MTGVIQFVVFRLDSHRFALPLAVVERVVQAAQVTPLPEAPPTVLGAINIHGQILPVLNIRRRFGLPERPIGPTDWFLLARTSRHAVVLVVDDSEGVIEKPHVDVTASAAVVGGLESFPGLVKVDDGLVLIHDLERFLSDDEARTLSEILDARSNA